MKEEIGGTCSTREEDEKILVTERDINHLGHPDIGHGIVLKLMSGCQCGDWIQLA
jgi:hypothetical protein